MAKKPKKIEQEVIYDVTGQANGPSPAEQAIADAEQLELMAKLKKERAPAEEAENRNRQERMQIALERASHMQVIAKMLDDLNKRVTALEAKNG